MGIWKKTLFYYCFLATVFIAVSTIFAGLRSGNILVSLLFLPVILYFAITIIKQRGSPQSHFSVKKKELAILAVLFLVLFGIGFLRVSSFSGPKIRTSSRLMIKTPLPLVSPKAVEQKANKTITIEIGKAVSYINIREKPITSSKIIGKAVTGDRFQSSLQEKDWYQISLKDGITGWISAEFVKK